MAAATVVPTIKLLQVRENEVKTDPTRTHATDAGYDLFCSRNTIIQAGTKAMVPTNLAMEIPDHLFGLVLPRSSAFYRKGLIIHPGTIDPGFRGEVMVLAYNTSAKAVYLDEGTSIAQILFLPRTDVKFDMKKLSESDRGKGGFGSTGHVPGEAPIGPLQP